MKKRVKSNNYFLIDKVFVILFTIFSIVLTIYLLLPNPTFPSQLNESLQSNEPADVETTLRRGYYTQDFRNTVMDHYTSQFSSIENIIIPTYRLNYPPEESQTFIRDQTRSTYLEEIVHPMRESIFISGFEPKLAKDTININGIHWNSKVIVKYIPSNIIIRLLIGLFTMIIISLLYLEYRNYFVSLSRIRK